MGLGEGAELGSTSRKARGCLVYSSDTATYGAAEHPSLWASVGCFTWVIKSRAVMMDTPQNGGNIRVVANIHLEVTVTPCVLCCRGELGLCLSYISFGVLPLSHKQMCTQTFC